MLEITIEREDDWFVITDGETGVTTQGRSKPEALLMLADALTGSEEADGDLLAMALDVFVTDPEDEAFVADLTGEDYVLPNVDDAQVARQREAALWLARTHKHADCSDPNYFSVLRALVFGRAPSPPIGGLADSVGDGPGVTRPNGRADDATPGEASDVVDGAIGDRFADVAEEATGLEDRRQAVDELRSRLAEHAGTTLLRPPLSEAAIESIEDDRLRTLAWDLDALARAYNYASDPTLPDLARADPRPWIHPDQVAALEDACASIRGVYADLLGRVGDDLERYRIDD